jgi:hypothetical protein
MFFPIWASLNRRLDKIFRPKQVVKLLIASIPLKLIQSQNAESILHNQTTQSQS